MKQLFKPKYITYTSNKARKEFIRDLTFINVGISILQVALTENFGEGVKELHVNKNRKEIKKIKAVFDRFLLKKKMIMNQMLEKDIKALDKSIKATSKPFVKTIASFDNDMNLHYLAIAILELGLKRDRKVPKFLIFNDFCDFKLLYGEIMESVEKAQGYQFETEWEAAQKFVNEVKLWL